MNETRLASEIVKHPDLVCECPTKEFTIGKECFKIILYGIYTEDDKGVCQAAEKHYACFINDSKDAQCFQSIDDCYEYAIDKYNDTLGDSLKDSIGIQ